jgi:hypothetical protein
MRKNIVVLMAVVLLGVAAFASPFAKLDVTLPNDGKALFGIQSGDFIVQAGVIDLLDTPGFAFQAALTQDFKSGLIETEYGVMVNDLGFGDHWYQPTLETFELTVSGVIHVGEIFCILNDDPDAIDEPVPTLDIYGGVRFVYTDPVLMPTLTVGLYWGDVTYGGNYWSLFDWL